MVELSGDELLYREVNEAGANFLSVYFFISKSTSLVLSRIQGDNKFELSFGTCKDLN